MPLKKQAVQPGQSIWGTVPVGFFEALLIS